MDPPKSATMRISANMGPASQYANSSMKVLELKGRKRQNKGDHYLQLSLGALEELANLLEDARLSKSEKAAYKKVYDSSMVRYDALLQLRDQLLSQKKSFREFLVNLFTRESDVGRFHRMSYWNYSTIRRTSDEVHRRILGAWSANFASEVHEENPRDVVESDIPVQNIPPDETIRGISFDVQTEQQANDALRTLSRITTLTGGQEEEGDDDDDGSHTIVPSESRPPSPSPSLTIIVQYTNNFINSVVASNSEVIGAAINNGVDQGTPASVIHPDTNQDI